MIRNRVFNLVIVSALLVLNCGIVSADYIVDAKSQMSAGTISGIRQAYDICEQAMGDESYPKSRELLFLYSLNRTAMLVAKDDGGQIDSFFELANAFDVEIVGDSIDSSSLGGIFDIAYPLNNRGSYELPSDAPTLEDVALIFDEWLIPEIDQIIEILDQIESPPHNKFEMYFYSSQTGMFSDLRIGYGEVLIFKGVLKIIRANLNSVGAYYLGIDDLEVVIEKICTGCFSFNRDLLTPNPDFLKLLPTANNASIGKDTLAQSATDTIDSLDYYVEAIEYIKSDDFDNLVAEGFLYLEESDISTADAVIDKLTMLRDSLRDDTDITAYLETMKTYAVSSPEINQGSLVMYFDLFDNLSDGSLQIMVNDMSMVWDVTDMFKYPDGLIELELEIPMYYGWGGGYISFYFDEEKTVMIDGFLSYWGDSSGQFADVVGVLSDSMDSEEIVLDLNPIYGSTPRYPEPLSLRDLLPEFDDYNSPLPQTVAMGLDNDATLGGVLPDMTQDDWQIDYALQPAGVFNIAQLYSWQNKYSYTPEDYSGVGFWLDEQLVFEDLQGDVDCDSVGNLDIDRVYMGFLGASFYGEIILADMSESDDRRTYEVIMSYSPGEVKVAGTLRFVMNIDNGFVGISEMFKWYDDGYGYGYWMSFSMLSSYITERGIQFRVDFSMSEMPLLTGKFLTVNSYEGIDYDMNNADINETHLRVGPIGAAYGNVCLDGFKDDMPVFVQAFTDPLDPDDSVVSFVRIDGAGDFTLEGIGLGWKGYIRAYTPIFGFENIFEASCLMVDDVVEVSQWKPEIYGIGLTLKYPDIIVPGQVVSGDLGNVDGEKRQVFVLDAVQPATYSFNVDAPYMPYGSGFVIYGLDSDDVVFEWESWQGSDIMWQCPLSGRYYVEISTYGPNMPEDDNSFELLVNSTTEYYCSDIANDNGIGAKDGVVNQYDFEAISGCWLEPCQAPDWCQFADINISGGVDFEDFVELANQWLIGDIGR